MIDHNLFTTIHDDVREITTQTRAILERVEILLQMLKDHAEETK